MKHLRIILLGGLMALGLMVPAGASAAPTTVCTSNPCGTPWVGPFGFELARTGKVSTEDAVLVINGVTITCTTIAEDTHGAGGEGSDGMGSILVNPGSPVTGNVNSLWFFNCTENVNNGPCTVITDAGAPLWPQSIANVPLAPGSDGTLTLSFNSISTSCTNVKLACSFGPGTVSASWYNPGNPARPDTTGPDAGASQFHFAGVTLPSASPSCLDATWYGNYAAWGGSHTFSGSLLWVL